MHIALANFCEVFRELLVDPSEHFIQQRESRNRAADYRQQLFVAMIEQGKPVASSCGLCNQALHAHKVAGPEHLDGVFVSCCFHMFHLKCALRFLHGNCPVCQGPFGFVPA